MNSTIITNVRIGRGEAVCLLMRIPFDLANAGARRALFEELGPAKRAIIISEGLIVYLTASEVGDLARERAARPRFSLGDRPLFAATPDDAAEAGGIAARPSRSPLKFAP